MSQTELRDASEHWIRNEQPADWFESRHSQVYFREKSLPAHPATSTTDLIKMGVVVTKALPDEWTVIFTGGLHRPYDVKYLLDAETKCVNLKIYYRRPGLRHLTEIVAEVKSDVDGCSGSTQGVSDR